MIYGPGKVANNTSDPPSPHLYKMCLMWNFTLFYWNYIRENFIKVHAQGSELKWLYREVE